MLEFGHEVGDTVIRIFARLIEGQIRETDLAARFGGEEFVVLMPGIDAEGVLQCAERIRAQFRQATIPPITRPVTTSFGVTTLGPADTVESLFKRVDRALYEAKDSGRDRMVTA